MTEDFRKPMTKARSKWEPCGGSAAEVVAQCIRAMTGDARYCAAWQRRVGDGTLTVIVSQGPMGWHLSIDFTDHRGRLSRYPRWDEIADARYEFVPEEVAMCMVLPRPEDYVAMHDTTFQLHEHPDWAADTRDLPVHQE